MGGMSELSPADPVSADPAPAAPPSKQRRLPTKKNTSVKNMAWALGLNLIVVALIAFVVVGLGRDDKPTASAGSQLTVDVADSASRGQDTLPFPVVVPEVPSGWRAVDARVHGTEQQWSVRYSAPSGMATLWEGAQYDAALTQRMDGSLRTTGQKEQINGADCEWFESPDGPVGLGCEAADYGLVVSGSANREELLTLMRAATASAR